MDDRRNAGVSNQLSPLEIKTKDFTRSVWGYSPEQVVDFLDKVAKSWECVQVQEKRLLDEIGSLNQELLRWKQKEQHLGQLRDEALKEAQTIIEKAQQDAGVMLAQVEDKALGIRQKTEKWLEDVLDEVEVVERQKSNFTTALRSALDSHYELLNSESSGEGSLSDRLNQFLKGEVDKSAQH